MITCNVFELRLELPDKSPRQVLDYLFYTDLPAGTLISLSCQRSYLNWKERECIWVGVSDEMVVLPGVLGDFNGVKGTLDVVECDENAARRFEELNSEFSAGIKSAVSDDLTVEIIVGARQRIRAFGKNNCNLHGAMVTDDGNGLKFVEIRKTLLVPMKKELQPIDVELLE